MSAQHQPPEETREPTQAPPKPSDAVHTHVWQPVGVAKDEQILYSPVSAADHVKVIRELAVTSCECGAIRKTEVSRKERWLNR